MAFTTVVLLALKPVFDKSHCVCIDGNVCSSVRYREYLGLKMDICAVLTPLFSSLFSRLEFNGGVRFRVEHENRGMRSSQILLRKRARQEEFHDKRDLRKVLTNFQEGSARSMDVNVILIGVQSRTVGPHPM